MTSIGLGDAAGLERKILHHVGTDVDDDTFRRHRLEPL